MKIEAKTQTYQTYIPSRDERDEAKEILAKVRKSKDVLAALGGEAKRNSKKVKKIFHAFEELLKVFASGQDLVIASKGREMTTQEAADFLNVSRPFVVSLIEEGKLPASTVGTHRRLLLDDVLVFREASMRKQRSAIDHLVREAQDLKLGYEE